jgi:dienelactone hydrolase
MLSMAMVLCGALPAQAAMVARNVDYPFDGRTYQGVLVYDDAISARRPGLLMIPNWYGIGADAVEKAKRIAGRDYVIFLGDMYGKGLRPDGNDAAGATVKPLYADRTLMRARVNAAFGQLRVQARSAPIDTTRLAAIGFCFGGSAVLDLARSGTALAAVVTFHGGLSTDDPALAKNIKAHVLVLNGADDRGTKNDVPAFLDEMRGSGADWQFIDFGNTVHCFTETGQNSPPNCIYDERSARRAYRLMHDWLDEAFAK